MVRYGIKGYNILLKGTMENPEDEKYKTKEKVITITL